MKYEFPLRSWYIPLLRRKQQNKTFKKCKVCVARSVNAGQYFWAVSRKIDVFMDLLYGINAYDRL